MSASCNINASFEAEVYEISAVAGDGGSISPESQEVTYGKHSTLTVTPDSGYRIEAVTGCGGTLDGNRYTTGVMSASCNINAEFSSGYILSEKDIIETDFFDRSYFSGFDLDDVLISSSENGQFSIVNNTPRFIKDPAVTLNGEYFMLRTLVYPFSRVEVSLPPERDEVEIIAAEFMDENPFFKLNLTHFDVELAEGEVGEFEVVTEYNAEQFVKEILGYKKFDNNFYSNLRFLHFVSSQSKAVLADIDADNSSSVSEKFVSKLMHKPNSNYRILSELDGPNGKAKKGDGYLSVTEAKLPSAGQLFPQSTYYHEKMHSHGFSDSDNDNSTMTYGWGNEIANYLKTNRLQFYDDLSDIVQESNYPLKYKYLNIDSETVSVLLTWGGKDGSNESIAKEFIDNVIIGSSELVELLEIGEYESGTFTKFDPSFELESKAVAVFLGGISIPRISFENFNNENDKDKALYIKFKRPSHSFQFAIIASSSERKDATGNAIFDYKPEWGLYDKDTGQIIFLVNEVFKDESGFFSKQYKQIPLDSARDFCESKGLMLGDLHPFRSIEMRDFQNKFLRKKSQMGISAETGEPTAVRVKSGTDISKMYYADEAEVIICRI